MFSTLLGCFGGHHTCEIDGPEFDILKEGEQKYGVSGLDGDTLDLSINSYCWALSERYSTRADMHQAIRVREVHLMREPHRRRYTDIAVPFDGAGGYRQMQDYDRDGVELDWWQKAPESESEYLVVSSADRQGSVGHIRLERQWMWERASPQRGLEDSEFSGGEHELNAGVNDEDGEDIGTWKPRRSIGVPHVIINRQSKLQRHAFGRRDVELGTITFEGQGKAWARETGKQEETDVCLYELALLALAVQRIQKEKSPWKAECRRRLREGNYARLLFDLVDQRRHSKFGPLEDIWYEGTEHQEDVDRVHTIHEFCEDLDKFQRKIRDKELATRRP